MKEEVVGWRGDVRPADGAELLDDVTAYIRRFVVMGEAEKNFTSLWVFHAHAIDFAEFTPYLEITSAEPECGKSQLLEVLEGLVPRPVLAADTTLAVLSRILDAQRPTLLWDEIDAYFGADKERTEQTRAILNAGYRSTGKRLVMAGQGTNLEVKELNVFSAKAFAGISGNLPHTITSRSVQIRLERALRGEVPEKYRQGVFRPQGKLLHDRVENWIQGSAEQIKKAKPRFPPGLSGRQEDVVEQLLAIADLAGGVWPEKSRTAISDLCSKRSAEDSSIGTQLLIDIRNVFEERGAEKISSSDLAGALAEIESSPWGEWAKGKPITAGKLTRLLRRFKISSSKVRIGDRTPWGFHPADFAEAFRRYLSPLSPGENSGTTDHATANSQRQKDLQSDYKRNQETEHGTDFYTETSEIANKNGPNGNCSVVPEKKPPESEGEGDGGSVAACWHCRGVGLCDCSSCGVMNRGAWEAGSCVPCGAAARKVAAFR